MFPSQFTGTGMPVQGRCAGRGRLPACKPSSAPRAGTVVGLGSDVEAVAQRGKPSWAAFPGFVPGRGCPGAAACQQRASGTMPLSWGYSLGSPPFSHGIQPHRGFFPRLLLRWLVMKDQGLFSGFPNLGASEEAAASPLHPALLLQPPPALHLHRLPGSLGTVRAGDKNKWGEMYFMHLRNASVEGAGAGENRAWTEEWGWFMVGNSCAVSPAAPYRGGRITAAVASHASLT